MTDEIMVEGRFNGPRASGNGGYSAGLFAAAAALDVPVRVTLRRPPPLDVQMLLGSDRSTCLFKGEKVMELAAAEQSPEVVDAVPFDVALDARDRYAGLRSHPFPTCFACGPERREGDGLRIFPGRVEDDLVASTWKPHASLASGSPDEIGEAVTWAALDCVGGWSSDIETRPMVLGQMSAVIDVAPKIGEEHVVVGRRLGQEGRRTFTASSLYDSDGRLVASASHTWVEVDVATFSGLNNG